MPAVVALAVVVFAFWRALLAGGTLVPHDVAASAAPFDAYRPDSFSAEVGPGDPGDRIDEHAHWSALGQDVRSGEFAWWNPRLGGGEPTMSQGLPVFNLAYLALPSWFAPGVVAAIQALVAIALMYGFLRSLDLVPLAALTAGVTYAFSGLMVATTGTATSTVVALVPGLLWAVHAAIDDPRPRRSVPIGIVIAAMVWASVPGVTGYALLGAAAYAIVRFLVRPVAGSAWPGGVSILVVLGGGGVLALGLSAPQLLADSAYRDWIAAPVESPVDDTSAGFEYVLTALTPSWWGSDSAGAAWFGEGTWAEFNSHVGSSVLLLTLIGVGVGLSDRGRRSTALPFVVVAAIGVIAAYTGGPIATALDSIVGTEEGAMTDARVLLAVSVAALAGLGMDRWVGHWGGGERSNLRPELARTLGVAVVAAVPLGWAMSRWFDEVQAVGATKQVLAASTASMLAIGVVAAVGVARWRRWVTNEAAGWIVLGAVVFELLLFAMPVPTIVSRDERLRATPAHRVAVDVLDPGERLAGDGDVFFPNASTQFGVPLANANVDHPPAFDALLGEVDHTDPTDPGWRTLGVGALAQAPAQMPVGALEKPAIGSDQRDAGSEEVRGSAVVPAGGLRAIVLDAARPEASFVTVTIEVGGDIHVDRRWRERADWSFVPIALVGEHYEPGMSIDVTISSSRAGGMIVAADETGAAVMGTVGGDDDYRLVRTGDVLITEILDTQFVRAAGGASVIDHAVGPDTLTATVEATTDSIVTFAVNHHPGWSATVDGEVVPIHRSDTAFMGVDVGPGRHTVDLTFRSDGLQLHLALLLISVLAATLLWFGPRVPGVARVGR